MTMRFDEVTNRLNATINYPGHADDGLPLNVAIPSIGTIRIWQAIHGGYTWAIMFEPALEKWSEEEKAAYFGYSASYRLGGQSNSSQTIRIDGGPWDSFTKAEDACKRTWKSIREAN